MEREPIDFTERNIIHNLRLKEAFLMAQLTEVRSEIQRVELGRKPTGIRNVLTPKDVFWRRTAMDINYENQANSQSDNLDV